MKKLLYLILIIILNANIVIASKTKRIKKSRIKHKNNTKKRFNKKGGAAGRSIMAPGTVPFKSKTASKNSTQQINTQTKQNPTQKTESILALVNEAEAAAKSAEQEAATAEKAINKKEAQKIIENIQIYQNSIAISEKSIESILTESLQNQIAKKNKEMISIAVDAQEQITKSKDRAEVAFKKASQQLQRIEKTESINFFEKNHHDKKQTSKNQRENEAENEAQLNQIANTALNLQTEAMNAKHQIERTTESLTQKTDIEEIKKEIEDIKALQKSIATTANEFEKLSKKNHNNKNTEEIIKSTKDEILETQKKAQEAIKKSNEILKNAEKLKKKIAEAEKIDFFAEPDSLGKKNGIDRDDLTQLFKEE